MNYSIHEYQSYAHVYCFVHTQSQSLMDTSIIAMPVHLPGHWRLGVKHSYTKCIPSRFILLGSQLEREDMFHSRSSCRWQHRCNTINSNAVRLRSIRFTSIHHFVTDTSIHAQTTGNKHCCYP